jgi:hypothetical protein
LRRVIRPDYAIYVEPFLGCGTSLFELGAAAAHRIACASKKDAAFWSAVRDRPMAVLAELEKCEQRLMKSASVAAVLDKEWRAWRRKPSVGRELFLRRHARVWGSEPQWFGVGRLINGTAFLRAAEALRNTEFLDASPLDLSDEADLLTEGTLVFLDMPVLAHEHAGPPWMAADAIITTRLAASWAARGAQVVLRHPAYGVFREIVEDVWPSAQIIEANGELVAYAREVQ